MDLELRKMHVFATDVHQTLTNPIALEKVFCNFISLSNVCRVNALDPNAPFHSPRVDGGFSPVNGIVPILMNSARENVQ